VKETDPEALVLGEVWEDASNKHSYGHRRRYLLGKQLDSVMNYPFRQAILDVVRDRNTTKFFETVCGVVENYPPQVTRLLMNSLGTHDTERALTLLAGEAANGRGRSWQAQTTMTEEQREHGCRLLRMAAVLQYCLPGVPCIYYGDEAGMEGYRDPFNRGCYPWGAEDESLVEWFRRLGTVRADNPVFAEGGFQPMTAEDGVVLFRRYDENGVAVCAVNCTEREMRVPFANGFSVAIGDAAVCDDTLILPPFTGSILIAKKV